MFTLEAYVTIVLVFMILGKISSLPVRYLKANGKQIRPKNVMPSLVLSILYIGYLIVAILVSIFTLNWFMIFVTIATFLVQSNVKFAGEE